MSIYTIFKNLVRHPLVFNEEMDILFMNYEIFHQECLDSYLKKGLCYHGKQKYRCRYCGGKGLCIHKIRKEYCKECKGSQICIHSKYKSHCRKCNTRIYCIHKLARIHCNECKNLLTK